MNTLISFKKAIILLALASVFASCHDEEKDAEAREEAKVGKVYNHDEQGIDIENRDNQFPVSRNNRVEGEGQETGAPSDTIDGDKDKSVVMPQQQTPEQRRGSGNQ